MSTNRLPRLRALAVVAAIAVSIAALSGCRGILRSRTVAFDLLDDFESASVDIETTVVDLGTPRGRDHLLAGWSDGDEKWAGVTSFVWGIGVGSSLRFTLFETKPILSITFRARPAVVPGRGVVDSVTVWLNGVRGGTVAIEPGFREYHVALLPDLQQIGENVLEFDYRERPEGVVDFAGSGSDRSNRVAWDFLRIDQGRGDVFPRTEARRGGRALLLPDFSSVEYELDLPPCASLEIASTRDFGPSWRSGPSLLRVSVGAADSGEEAWETLEVDPIEAPAPVRWSLPVAGAARLRLLAVTKEPFTPAALVRTPGGPETDAGVLLVSPRITVSGSRCPGAGE